MGEGSGQRGMGQDWSDTGFPLSPRAGGSCFRECGGRALLTNVSSVALGSRRLGGLLPPGGGAARAEPGLLYCVWVVSATEVLQPCAPGTQCPPLTLTFSPDSSTPCTVSSEGARVQTRASPPSLSPWTLTPTFPCFHLSNPKLCSCDPSPSFLRPQTLLFARSPTVSWTPVPSPQILKLPFLSPGMINVYSVCQL